MPWHFTFRSLPELAGFTRREREAFVRKCAWKAMRRPRVLASVLPVVVLGFGFIGVYPFLIAPHLVRARAMFFVGSMGLIVFSAVLFPLAIKAILIVHMRRDLRAAVGGLCLGCGYDLRASAGRCPECGEAIVRGVVK